MREKVALLGSSGIVSQRFQQRLANHPWFELAVVFGSSKNAGKPVSELPWNLPEPAPKLPEIPVMSCPNSEMNIQLDKLNVQLVFSALPTAEASEIEPLLRAAGKNVFSNSSPHRMDADIPLVIPELNPDHLSLLSQQKSNHNGGSIACSTNCTVMPIAMPLRPIFDEFGIKSLTARTFQSLSGGGLKLMQAAKKSGIANTEIPGEAEKICEEALRLLGKKNANAIIPANFSTDISCNRVMRNFGHQVEVSLTIETPTTKQHIIDLLSNFHPLPQKLELPSAPSQPILLSDSPINPEQHCWAGAKTPQNRDPATDLHCGMAIVVADIKVQETELSFNAFSENTIRGAAGGCLLLAELAFKQGMLV